MSASTGVSFRLSPNHATELNRLAKASRSSRHKLSREFVIAALTTPDRAALLQSIAQQTEQLGALQTRFDSLEQQILSLGSATSAGFELLLRAVTDPQRSDIEPERVHDVLLSLFLGT